MELMALYYNGLRATLVIENSTYPPQDVSKICLDIICGFPQGSIHGPPFFLIYVNTLFKASNPLMEVMFADDKISFYPIKV